MVTTATENAPLAWAADPQQDKPADASRLRPGVAMIVMNSVSHDARVIKEAHSLTAAGYNVTVIGIRDRRNMTADETLDDAIRVVRVSLKGKALSDSSKSVSRLCFILLAVAVRTGLLQTLLLCGAVLGLLLDPEMSRLGRVALALVAGLLAVSHPLIGGVLARCGLRSLQRWVPSIQWIVYALKLHQWRKQVREQLEQLRPDVVHCHDVFTLPVGAAYKRRHVCRLVYDSHELAEHQNRLSMGHRWMFRYWQRRHGRAVDGFVTVNDSIAAYLNRAYPQLPEAVVVRNATLRYDAPATAYDGRLHAAAELPSDRKILLYQGGFSRNRGLEQLVRTAPLLDEQWTMVFMGSGNLGEGLQAEVQSWPEEQRRRIVFIPPAPYAELAQWTSGASLGAILYENTCLNHQYCSPNKLWEYPNAGVPILATDLPEMAAIVRGHGVGWLLDDCATPEVIAATVNALDDEQLAEARVNCGRFLEQDNWSVYAGRLTRLYARLVGFGNGEVSSLLRDVPSQVARQETSSQLALRNVA